MKILGPKSVSSFLKLTIKAVWFLQLLFFPIILGVIVFDSVLSKDRVYKWPVAFSPLNATEIQPIDTSISEVNLSATSGELAFRGENTWSSVSLTCIGLCLIFGTSLLVTYQLKQILQSVSGGRPFLTSNVNRIRFIGWTLITYSIVKVGYDLIYIQFLSSQFTWKVPGYFIQKLDLTNAVIGLFVLVLAEIFSQGVALREETELTI